LRYLDDSIKLAQELNLREEKISLYLDYIKVYLDSKQFEKFHDVQKQTQKLLEDNQNLALDAEFHLLLGIKELEEKNQTQASDHLSLSLKISEKLNQQELLWRLHHQLGKLKSTQNDFEKAFKELSKAKEILKSLTERITDPQSQKSYLQDEEKNALLSDMKNLAQLLVTEKSD